MYRRFLRTGKLKGRKFYEMKSVFTLEKMELNLPNLMSLSINALFL